MVCSYQHKRSEKHLFDTTPADLNRPVHWHSQAVLHLQPAVTLQTAESLHRPLRMAYFEEQDDDTHWCREHGFLHRANKCQVQQHDPNSSATRHLDTVHVQQSGPYILTRLLYELRLLRNSAICFENNAPCLPVTAHTYKRGGKPLGKGSGKSHECGKVKGEGRRT